MQGGEGPLQTRSLRIALTGHASPQRTWSSNVNTEAIVGLARARWASVVIDNVERQGAGGPGCHRAESPRQSTALW